VPLRGGSAPATRDLAAAETSTNHQTAAMHRSRKHATAAARLLSAVALACCAALLAAPAPAAAQQQQQPQQKPAGPARGYPGLIPVGARDASDPAISVCSCVDHGINSEPCFRGVTAYCTKSKVKPNATVCSAMTDFINQQEVAAGLEMAEFMYDMCAVQVPPGANSCACLEVGGWGSGCGGGESFVVAELANIGCVVVVRVRRMGVAVYGHRSSRERWGGAQRNRAAYIATTNH